MNFNDISIFSEETDEELKRHIDAISRGESVDIRTTPRQFAGRERTLRPSTRQQAAQDERRALASQMQARARGAATRGTIAQTRRETAGDSAPWLSTPEGFFDPASITESFILPDVPTGRAPIRRAPIRREEPGPASRAWIDNIITTHDDAKLKRQIVAGLLRADSPPLSSAPSESDDIDPEHVEIIESFSNAETSPARGIMDRLFDIARGYQLSSERGDIGERVVYEETRDPIAADLEEIRRRQGIRPPPRPQTGADVERGIEMESFADIPPQLPQAELGGSAQGLFNNMFDLSQPGGQQAIIDEIRDRIEDSTESASISMGALARDIAARMVNPLSEEARERFLDGLQNIGATLANTYGAGVASIFLSGFGLNVTPETIQALGQRAHRAGTWGRAFQRFTQGGQLHPGIAGAIQTARDTGANFMHGMRHAWGIVGGYLEAAAPLLMSNQGAAAVAALAVGAQLYRSGALHHYLGKIPGVAGLFASNSDDIQQPIIDNDGRPVRPIPAPIKRYVKVLKQADKFLMGTEESQNKDLALAVNIEKLLKSSNPGDKAAARNNAEMILNSIVFRAHQQAAQDILTPREKFGGPLELPKVPPGRQVINPPKWII